RATIATIPSSQAKRPPRLRSRPRNRVRAGSAAPAAAIPASRARLRCSSWPGGRSRSTGTRSSSRTSLISKLLGKPPITQLGSARPDEFPEMRPRAREPRAPRPDRHGQRDRRVLVAQPRPDTDREHVLLVRGQALEHEQDLLHPLLVRQPPDQIVGEIG